MIFVVELDWYNEDTLGIEPNKLFVFAKTFAEVVERLSEYYGEDEIDRIEIKPFSPDNFLAFSEIDTELFYRVRDQLGEKVIW